MTFTTGPRRRLPLASIGLWLLLVLGGLVPSRAADFVPGQSYFGRNDYIEYIAGNLPIIITAPHGGHLTPQEIPDRTWGTTVTDTNTRPQAIAMADVLFERTGKHPHLIISHLRRTKLDPNREIVEAAQGNPHAEQAWHEFHGFIAAARAAAEAEFGFGFLADIHGHGHEIQRIELGYGLGNSQLNRTDSALEAPGFGWDSSLRTLMLRRPGVSFPELLRGPGSLGERLVDRGIPTWPSATFPSPDGAPFFSGGYITRQHTCFVDNGVINGVQFELHWNGVRNTAANRSNFALQFARVMEPYLYENYGYVLGANPFYRLASTSAELERGAAPLQVTVLRTGFIDLATTVTLDFGGTATQGADYTVSSQSISFSRGQTSGSVFVTPAAAGGPPGDRTIVVSIAPDFRQAADPTPMTITLGDGVTQRVRIAAENESVWESDGHASFRLWRTSTAGEVTVNLGWTGSATPGADYDFLWQLPGQAHFPAGVESVVIPVRIVDDGIPEADEVIQLRVLDGNGYLVRYPGTARVVVRDNDAGRGMQVWLRGEVEGNRLIDSSGWDRHATTLPAGRGPAPHFTPQGPAFSFDGVEATAALPRVPFDSEDGFSLAFHFRIDASSSTPEHNLISYGPRGSPGSINIHLSSATNLRTRLGDAPSTSFDLNSTWTNGQWRHYALTVDGQGVARLFLNGQQVRQRAGWNGPLDPNELGWRRDRGTANAFLGGAMRDVRVYNRALAPEEVTALSEGRLTFAAWRQTFGLPAHVTPTTDLAGNGLALLQEYGFGADPLTSDRAPRWETRIHQDRLALHFLRQTSGRDLHWLVEATSDPAAPWEVLAEHLPGASTWTVAPGVGLLDQNGLVEVRDRRTLAESPQRFLRVRLELQP